MLERFVQTLVEITLAMSAVIVVFALACALTKKRYAPKWRCLVWGVVAVRLLLPFNLTLPAPPVQLQQRVETVPIVRQYHPPMRAPIIPEKDGRTGEKELSAAHEENLGANPTTAYAARTQERSSGVSYRKSVSVEEIAFLVWMVGLLVLAGYYSGNILRFRRYWKRFSHMARRERTRNILAEEKEKLCLRQNVRLTVCASLSSPVAAGLIHPTICLTTEECTADELRAILRHELQHIKRRDLWKKLLFLAAKLVHWFNPLVWWMEWRANREIEFACDASVVAGEDADYRTAYGETILKSIRRSIKRGRPIPVLSSMFNGKKRALRERMQIICDDGKKRRGALLLALLTVVALGGGSLVACGGVTQTNQELTVFCYGDDALTLLQSVKNSFQLRHPHVSIKFYDIPTYSKETNLESPEKIREARESYYKSLSGIYGQVRQDLMMGKGPDLIFFSQVDEGAGVLFDDLDKVMSAGVFADLTPFMEADEGYHPESYNSGVMEAGQYKGKQYAMPLYYTVPILRASAAVLRQEQFDISAVDHTVDLLNEASRYKKAGGTRRIFAEANRIGELPRYAGLNLFDFEKRSVELDHPELRRMEEQIKELHQEDIAERTYPQLNMETDWYYEKSRTEYYRNLMQAVWISEDGDTVLGEADSLFALYGDYRWAMDYWIQDLEYDRGILLPLRAADGKIAAQVTMGAAISNSSPNQQNAYDFLSMAINGNRFFDSTVFPDMLPVSDDFVAVVAEKSAESYEAVYPGYGEEIYEQALELSSWLTDIGHADFRSGVYDRLSAYFEPYYNGEASYEECIKKAKQELLLYVTE